ncbi:MAG: type II secretion system F family protein [Deltaproteobacteria bacterium]|nr:type II secretion system F family protein [Deltaproteobacteria bacterium]
MILVITLSVFAVTAMGVLALFFWSSGRQESLANRLQEVVAPASEAPPAPSLRAREWAARLWGKSDPVARQREEIVSRVTSEDISGHRLLLTQAGYRSAAAERVHGWTRIAAPLLLPAVLFAATKAIGMPDKTVFLLAVAGAAAGLFLPATFLRSKARKRQEAITDSLPDALDLLTVCVEAGLGINSAFLRIAEEFRLSSPTLSEEVDVVNREIVAGKPRMEALRAFSDRTGVEDVKSLVAMLIQTERLGTSLAQSLRVHSDSLRVRRRQRAEEAAAKTTIKLVFPLVFLLFPALFIVILGPGVLQILHILFPSINAATGG